MVPKQYKLNNLLSKTTLGAFFILLVFFMASPGYTADNTQVNITEAVVLDDTDSSLKVSTYGPPIDVQGNGTRIKVQAGDLTRLRIRDQLQVNLSLQEDCELHLNISDSNPAGPLPANMFQFRYYYQFELNQSTQLQANFSMAFNQSELPKDVTPEQLSWAYYNTYTNQWEYVHSWLNEYKNMLNTQTNHFSTWTILQQPQNESVATIAMQGNGTMVKMKAQQQYQIKLQSKFQVNVSFGDDVEFSINETADVPFQYTFENHYRFGNVWQLETNNSQVQLNATFGFPYDPTLIPGDAKQEQLRFYYFNTTRNQWQEAYSWVNTEQHMIFAESNHFSTWTVFVEKNATKPIEPKKDSMNDVNANGTPMKIENGYTYQFRTQSGFELNLSLGQTAELSMNESTTHQYQNQVTAQRGIGMYLSLELNETGVSIEATLAYKVASSDVPTGADPLKLQFAYYNTVTNQWEVQNSWVTDIGSGYYMVYANTTHFSTWTILSSETTDSASSSSSSNAPGFELIPLLLVLGAIPIIKKRNK